MIRKTVSTYHILAMLGLMIVVNSACAEVRPEVVERIKPVGVVVVEGPAVTAQVEPEAVAEQAPAPVAEAASVAATVESAPVVAAVEGTPAVAEAAPVAAVPAAGVDGEAVYSRACFACHMSGAANSPKLGDKAAWAPRIAKGMDALYLSAVNGVAGTAMPPRGTCAACSDDELKAAVDFMVSKAR